MSQEAQGVQEIYHDDTLLAIIVPHDMDEAGVHFFTPNHFSQQIAFMGHEAGHDIAPHTHNAVKREVHFTQEVLIIKSGKLRVDFYSEQQTYLKSYLLVAGDTILLASGGHGFHVVEEVRMLEIKQGPYAGDHDKTRFRGVVSDQVVMLSSTTRTDLK